MSASAPSPFLLARLERLRATGGPVLDLACGRGRHARACAAAGLACVALDRDRAALGELAGVPGPLWPVRADAESRHGIPFRSCSFGAVLVFRFLFRPLAPELERVLRPGGLLLYETFTRLQRDRGQGPRNPAFLLDPGELPRLFPGLEVLHHEEGLLDGGAGPAQLARLLARRS